MIFFSNKNRPFDYGPYPLERLSRDASVIEKESARPAIERPAVPAIDTDHPMAAALDKYHNVFRNLGVVEAEWPRAPAPDDLARRTQDIKGSIYFLDASQCGICEMPETAWLKGVTPLPHTHAIVIMQAFGRVPEKDNPAHRWIEGQEQASVGVRTYEIAVGIAEYLQFMGYKSKAHDLATGDVDLERLTVLAGLGYRTEDGVENPYLGQDYGVSIVTTDYALVTDLPLAASARRAKGLGYWLGMGGAVPGIEWNRRNKRRSDLGMFPMEQVKRVDKPTTLIIEDEVPRISRRAEFGERAAHGDMGEKARVERNRFGFKHPYAQGLVSLIMSMIPHQGGEPTPEKAPGLDDPAANSRAIKSLSYFLGAELTGICEIPDYAWYSHNKNGKEVVPYHKYAVVMMIDQGYETMEGASGDDFISGAQSIRAYMRGAEIGGIMAELLRLEGHSSRSHTNAVSDLLHIPLAMWAGLGELSRIGEVVLNPFIGPRLKTVVITTDLPMEVDKPVDFGLQDFCNSCQKCARNCPCDAISWGDKVMYNGYEMWKPDMERCARYRITNPKGLGCGRCMKTCPLNKVVTWQGPLMTRVASWIGVNVRWMKPIMIPLAVWLDDFLRNGVRNPVKKWWLDLEIINGAAVHPAVGVNARELDVTRKLDPAKQKITYQHANMNPPPNQMETVPLDRKAGTAAAAVVETPLEALARLAAGGPTPEHYIPTPALGDDEVDLDSVLEPAWDYGRRDAKR